MNGSVLIEPSWPEKIRIFKGLKEVLWGQALEQQQLGQHWKKPPFLVGGTGVGWSPRGLCKIQGHNYKPHPGSMGSRTCMEEHVEAEAMLLGCTVIIGIVCAACYQVDDTVGEDMHGTLPPCYKCRVRIAKSVRDGGLYALETQFCQLRVDRPYIVTAVAEYSVADLLQQFPVRPEDLV